MTWGHIPQSDALDLARRKLESPSPVDDFLETYLSWCEEAVRVRGAYADWCAAPERDAAWAFTTYRAALEREEHAAGLLRGAAERLASATKTNERTSY
jgi:hypothetical protein